MSTISLSGPYLLGSLQLKNRVVMAPLTRSRAEGNVPNALMALYYAQRSEAGLIITEGTSPAAAGLGYPRIPGLFLPEHSKAWKEVTKAVHAEGAKIFVQLMHTGRVSHVLNLPQGAEVLAPSALPLSGQVYTDSAGLQPYSPPKAMSEAEIEAAIESYVHASKLAIEAGFDGVELHAANGYLIEQFINPTSNQRTDAWGGSIAKRLRFPLEIARRVSAAIGSARVGIRISPYGVFNDMGLYPEIDETYALLATELSKLGLVYLHVVDHSSMGAPAPSEALKAQLRKLFQGTYILSGGYDKSRAESDLNAKKGDLVAFGRAFIANPKLVSCLTSGRELAQPDPSTFYTPGPVGYTDYPDLP